MKKQITRFLIISLNVFLLAFSGCASNPFTGGSTLALVSNAELFPMSFQAYGEFLNENTVVTGTPDAEMVTRVGNNLRMAAEAWLASEGQLHFLNGYSWEFNLIENNAVNAWCMPGGKIVIYTGILPVTQNEDGLAVVMGHEIAHALLNHGQRRMSGEVVRQGIGLGLGLGLALGGASNTAQIGIMAAYDVGSTVGGTLPFSRSNESEADQYGLILMTIAGYDPEESVPFWQRMSAGGGGTVEFLSTHPSDERRIRQLREWIPMARDRAAQIR